jgi:hypothetical protein
VPGATSQTGDGVSVSFPNGTTIMTTNDVGGLTVSADGKTISSTSAVATKAFTATGTVSDSNTAGSGPGGYAYNWCTFTSWSLTKQ